MNVARRFLTLPLRRRTADFYIVGFPKVAATPAAGTRDGRVQVLGRTASPATLRS